MNDLGETNGSEQSLKECCGSCNGACKRENGYYLVTVPHGWCDDVFHGLALFLLLDGRLYAPGVQELFKPSEAIFREAQWFGPMKRRDFDCASDELFITFFMSGLLKADDQKPKEVEK